MFPGPTPLNVPNCVFICSVIFAQLMGESPYRLVVWSSGRTSVLAFAVLRSTCSWWVTTYVTKPSAIVNQLGQLSLHPFGVDKWVVSCNWMSAASVVVVVPSGERSWRKGRHGVLCRYNCVIHAWALCMYLGAKGCYINTLPFLSYTLQWATTSPHQNCPFACGTLPSVLLHVGWAAGRASGL